MDPFSVTFGSKNTQNRVFKRFTTKSDYYRMASEGAILIDFSAPKSHPVPLKLTLFEVFTLSRALDPDFETFLTVRR